MSRKISRQIIIELLFAADINNAFSKDFFSHQLRIYPFEEILSDLSLEDRLFIDEILNGVAQNKEYIDKIINKYSKDWHIDRIGKIELAILRESVYSLLFRQDIPEKVAVNEAVENAKKYCRDESYRFINGILASVIKKERVL